MKSALGRGIIWEREGWDGCWQWWGMGAGGLIRGIDGGRRRV